MAAALLTGLLIAACSDGGNGAGNHQPLPPPGSEARVGEAGIDPYYLALYDPAIDAELRDAAAEATLHFGLALYKAMADEGEDGDNLVISPLSIAAALGMLLPGTRDAAGDELVEALQLQATGTPHQAVAGLLYDIGQRDAADGITLSIANRSFVQRDWGIHADYVEALARWFGDAMAVVDFMADPEGARERVNDWVAAQTNDLIPELMPEGSIDGLTRLVLVNALYLLADWHEAFEPEATRSEAFTRRDGETVMVDMMHARREALPVAQGPGYAAFELAYAGEELALAVIVPDDWDSFAAGLDAQQIADILDGLSPTEAEIGLPRLETTTAASLIPALRALGVSRIFEPDPRWLSGIADDPDLHVAAVQHETFMKMDEEGTEAAAATGIGVGVTSAPPDVVRIVADRPYFLVLRDRSSGGVLFLGRILDPT